MKTKTIKAVLRKKIDEWLATIEDENLRNRVKSDVIVTGGAIASMLLKEPVNDYDIYFRTKETTVAVAEYYVAKFAELNPEHRDRLKVEVTDDRVRVVTGTGHRGETAGFLPEEAQEDAVLTVDPTMVIGHGNIDETYQAEEDKALANEDRKYKPVFISTNAVTLSNKVQLILRFYGEPDAIHANYDFIHATNYWLSRNDELVLKQEALEALLSRELRYVGSRYPLCSLIRLRKFIKRNWTINAGQILKMAIQLNELNLKDPNVLEEQLTGVDMAYFGMLIHAVREKDPNHVDASYIVEIVDRMF